MAFQVSGCTVIDNDRNIVNTNNMCVGSVTMTGSNGNITTPGTVTAGAVDFPLTVTAFNPSNLATNVSRTSNVTITFNQLIKKGTGTITIRSGSASGTILQSIAVTSGSVTTSAATVTIVTNTYPHATTIFVVVPSGAFLSNFNNPSPLINTYRFTTIPFPALGSSFGGGTLICRAGGVFWIAAPSASEVTRFWASRGDSNTRAQQVTGCTGWFVPSRPQLQNPGYNCRTFWPNASAVYWSNSQAYGPLSGPDAQCINFSNGACGISTKSTNRRIRSFRTLSY